MGGCTRWRGVRGWGSGGVGGKEKDRLHGYFFLAAVDASCGGLEKTLIFPFRDECGLRISMRSASAG